MGDLFEAVRLAIPLIKRLEGCVLQAYPDPASGGDPWTIGYGATGPEIVKGVVWTQTQADEDLAKQCAKLATQIAGQVKVPLSPASRAALMSFAYNVGISALSKSTLLKLINQRKYKEAADQFQRWNIAAGKVFPGLIRRRKIEREAFLAGLTPQNLT